MKKICFFWFFLIFCSASIEWEALPLHVGESIEISGFAYPFNSQEKGGYQILAKEPQLKSCCIGAFSKQKQQIFFHLDKKTTSYQRVTLQGDLVEEKDEMGRPRYVLKNALCLENSRFYITIALCLVLSFLFFGRKIIAQFYKKK